MRTMKNHALIQSDSGCPSRIGNSETEEVIHSPLIRSSLQLQSTKLDGSLRFVLLIVALALLGKSAGVGFAQLVVKSLAQRQLDERMPAWLKAFDVTGVGTGYFENGKLAWTAFYGDQVPCGPAANDKTLYSIASLIKPITAEIILRLASAGRPSLDQSVEPYWTYPDLKDNPWTKLLTSRLCLTHQTGIPNWRYQTNNVLKSLWQPATRFGYSGEGYDYVAHFAESLTGVPFEELARQYVFAPLGLNDTSYMPRPRWSGRQAKPVESEPRTRWGAADLLRTTAEDYARFVISVMHNEGISHGNCRRASPNLQKPHAQSVRSDDCGAGDTKRALTQPSPLGISTELDALSF